MMLRTKIILLLVATLAFLLFAHASYAQPSGYANSKVKVWDGTNNLSITAGGAIKTDGTATTQPISGTVAATQSGAWTNACTQSGTWSDRITDGTDTAQVEAAATYTTSLDPTTMGLTVNSRAQQIWDPNHVDNAGAGADGKFYGQNQDPNGNLSTNLSSIRGKLLRFKNQIGTTISGTNPPSLPIGGYGSSSTPTAVTAGRAVDAYFDLNGRLGTFAEMQDGAGTALTSATYDSRTGIDTQASSIATKNLIDFHSDVGGLAGGATKIFSPGGTRSTYYDTQGYGLLNIAFTDNSPGAGGGTLYIRWSRDGTNTPFNDPADGTGLTNYTTAVNATTDGLVVVGRLLPLAARYVNFVYVNNGTAQGTTYPQLAEIRVDLQPIGFSTGVTVTNGTLSVIGAADATAASGQPVVIGGIDNIGAPTANLPIVVTATGQATVTGGSTSYTGNALVTAEKMGTTGTLTNVAEATSSTTLAASSTSRRGFTVYNDTANVLKLKFGSTASATSFTYSVAAAASLTLDPSTYSGIITGISTGTGGNWRVTTW